MVSSCALYVTAGCGRSGGKGATMDAALGDTTVSDMALLGSGGASAGGASGTGGAGTGGAGAKGGEDASLGSGGIVTGGVGGTPTGGSGGSAAGGSSGSGGRQDASADASVGGAGGISMSGGAGGGMGGISTGGSGGLAAGGSGGSGGSGGRQDASASGSGGVSMSGGAAGGRGGTIGSGGSSASSCPQSAPTNGAACNQPAQCFYGDCAASGRTVATCSVRSWQVTTGACASFSCVGRPGGVQITCPQEQICLTIYKKDPVCVAQTCGTGPLTTECVPGASPGAGSCWMSGSAAEGITVSCCQTAGTSC